MFYNIQLTFKQFNQIKNFEKTWEGRLANTKYQSGDIISFSAFNNNILVTMTKTIVEIKEYKSFDLAFKDLGKRFIPNEKSAVSYNNVCWSHNKEDANLTNKEIIEKYSVVCLLLD